MLPACPFLRTRLALLSLLVSGLALLAFAVPAWLLIGRMDLQRIDHEVRLRALPHLAFFPDNRHWGQFEDLLRYTYGARAADLSFLLVRDRAGRAVRKSASWPPGSAPTVSPRRAATMT